MTAPLADVPINVHLLEAEVAEMERLIALLKRRAEHEAFLLAHGVDWTPRKLTMGDIIRVVALRRNLRQEDLIGETQSRDHVEARHESMYLCRRQCGEDGEPIWSFPQIGEAHGGRDHTSVINGIRRHEERLRATGAILTGSLAPRRLDEGRA